MEANLAVLAEIAIGLAGFSSVVVAFRRGAPAGRWGRGDSVRFHNMLEAALAAALFSVLPAAGKGLGIAESVLWPSLSVLLVVYLLTAIVRGARNAAGLATESVSHVLILIIGLGSSGTIIVQLLAAFGWLVPRGPGPYVLGVTWIVIVSGINFYRLLTAPTGEMPDAGSSLAEADESEME